MSTHNLCFGAKKKEKKVYPCMHQFCHIKVGVYGVFIARTCFPDVLASQILCFILMSCSFVDGEAFNTLTADSVQLVPKTLLVLC